jgi:hypothetical protein
VHDAPRTQLDDEEGIDLAKEQIDDGQEIARPNVLGVVFQEGRPILTGSLPRPNLAHAFLNGGCGDLDALLDEFAVDALSSPEDILLGHLLDPSDRFCGQFCTTAAVSGFEFPKEPKALTMPVQQGIGFKDQEGFLPILNAASEKDEPEAAGLSEAWLFDFAVEDNELLPEQRILGDEFGFASREVGGCGEDDRIPGRLGEAEEATFESS